MELPSDAFFFPPFPSTPHPTRTFPTTPSQVRARRTARDTPSAKSTNLRTIPSLPKTFVVTQGTAAGSSSGRSVLQLFRRPFLSDEAAATLARKANAKPAIGGRAAASRDATPTQPPRTSHVFVRRLHVYTRDASPRRPPRHTRSTGVIVPAAFFSFFFCTSTLLKKKSELFFRLFILLILLASKSKLQIAASSHVIS